MTISEKMTASALRLPVNVPMPALPSASRVARRARAAAIHVSAEVVSFTHVHTASGFFAQTGSILEPSQLPPSISEAVAWDQGLFSVCGARRRGGPALGAWGVRGVRPGRGAMRVLLRMIWRSSAVGENRVTFRITFRNVGHGRPVLSVVQVSLCMAAPSCEAQGWDASREHVMSDNPIEVPCPAHSSTHLPNPRPSFRVAPRP